VLIIGTFSIAGERLFTLADAGQRPAYYNQPKPVNQTYARPTQNIPSNIPTANYPRPAPKPRPAPMPNYAVNRPEPTYHPVGMTAMGRSEQNSSVRR
jgi:hypothetical protein